MRFNALVSRKTRLLVQWENSMPGAVLAAFRTGRETVVLLLAEVASEGRLRA